ncbi:MAG: sigma-70 family RNA polymerase sigma factor [Caldilineaceae bacterium]
MQELEFVIQQAARGDVQAFERIVQRFQDMAVGYAYSLLGDFHLAQDAAQEAFVQIHKDLVQLREPKAFPSWFRTVVYKQCDRMTRRKRVRDVSLETTLALRIDQPSPSELVESDELRQAVQAALLLLPEVQQQVIVLFYIAEYSQKEIASFLDVPVTTVKKRLHDAKKQLKERMANMAQEYFQGNRPSQNQQFREKVLDVIAPERAKHSEAIYALFEMDQQSDSFQWRAGRLAQSHVDWAASRIGLVRDAATQTETVITAMQVYALNLRIGGARVRSAGFNCEVTHPAYADQRATLIERTVTATLAAIKEQGYDLAISFDDEAFWYKHGFVFGWRALEWRVDVRDLPVGAPLLPLQRFQPNHRDDLAQIYNQTHQTLTGTAERPTYLRNKHPDMFMGWYWTDAQGQPAGYVSGGADRYFTLDHTLQFDLDQGKISEPIRQQFALGPRWFNPPLSAAAVCKVQQLGSQWLIEDGERQCFIYKEDGQLQGAVFDRPLFWVDEVAGDPELCLVALAQLARQWQCTELFFDRLHYKSGVGKRLRQMRSCRIHTGTFSGAPRSYVVRIINLPTLFQKLAPELAVRLQRSHLAAWQGNLRISLKTPNEKVEVMLAIHNGEVTVAPVVETPHRIQGGQALAQLILGTESPDEVVEMTGITLAGDAEQLVPVLFPLQYPQMENQAL